MSESNVYVQSFIDNFTAPQSLEELRAYIENHGWYNVEDIMYDDHTSWTVPKWCKKGDVVFFMHAISSDSQLKRIRKEIAENKNVLDEDELYLLNFWIKKGLRLHHMYGGKIMALAVVTGAPFMEDDWEQPESFHWSSKIYADMDIFHLDNPIDRSEFMDFITISKQSAITGVFGKEFDRLMKLVTDKNDVPEYFKTCIAANMPLSKISEKNYLNLTLEYRRAFFLESQFRSFFVDHFLSDFSDKKHFFRECACYKESKAPSFVDNLIMFNKKYLPVEVKLNIDCEKNLVGQLEKYTRTNYIIADGKQILPHQLYNDDVMVIDTEGVYLYKNGATDVQKIERLNNLLLKEDVLALREKIASKIAGIE